MRVDVQHRAVASGRAGRVLARPLFVAISSPVFVHSFPALIVRAAIVIRCGAGAAGCIDIHVFQRKVTQLPLTRLDSQERALCTTVAILVPTVCKSTKAALLGTSQHSSPDTRSQTIWPKIRERALRAIHGPTCSFLLATALTTCKIHADLVASIEMQWGSVLDH